MTTPDTIYWRLQNDFDCRLSTEQFLSIINVLEKRLAVDVVRKTQVTEFATYEDKSTYYLDFPVRYITRVFLNDQEIKMWSLENTHGYFADNNEIAFSKPLEKGTLYVESVVVPEDFDEYTMLDAPLFLGDGYDEIYLYHILSREALMNGDIDMVNNYSLLYAQALSSLKAQIEASETEEPKTEEPKAEGKSIQETYKNIW